jgi:pimeloyl-ACP methyl ester carboxylesterase
MEENGKNISIGSASVFMRDEGEGEPTLFLHGLLDSSLAWDAAIARLKKRLRCLAPDLPGFGRSTAPEDFDCSLPALAEFTNQLLKSAHVREPINLVVHDIGGVFGLAWAVSHSKHVRRLVILNTTFFSDHEWYFWSPAWRKPMIGEMGVRMLTRGGFQNTLKQQSPNLPEDYLLRTAEFLTPQAKKMTLKLLRATSPTVFRGWEPQLRALIGRVPTLVLWADRDPGLRPDLAEKFGAAKVEHFANYGHWLPAEGGDELAKRLRDFLAPVEEPPAKPTATVTAAVTAKKSPGGKSPPAMAKPATSAKPLAPPPAARGR